MKLFELAYDVLKQDIRYPEDSKYVRAYEFCSKLIWTPIAILCIFAAFVVVTFIGAGITGALYPNYDKYTGCPRGMERFNSHYCDANQTIRQTDCNLGSFRGVVGCILWFGLFPMGIIIILGFLIWKISEPLQEDIESICYIMKYGPGDHIPING